MPRIRTEVSRHAQGERPVPTISSIGRSFPTVTRPLAAAKSKDDVPCGDEVKACAPCGGDTLESPQSPKCNDKAQRRANTYRKREPLVVLYNDDEREE